MAATLPARPRHCHGAARRRRRAVPQHRLAPLPQAQGRAGRRRHHHPDGADRDLRAPIAALVLHQDPNAIDNVHWQGYPLAPGIAGHLLGTDENGRDLLARLIYGAQISLTVALFAVFMEITLGTVLGAISGYYGGWVDFVIMRVTDVVLSIPLLPLLLVLTAIVAGTSNKAALNFGVIVLIIGGLSWPAVARLVRASFLSCASASSPKRPRRWATATGGSSSATCCPTRSRRSSCRRRSRSPTSSSWSRRCRSWASESSRRRRRGATCSPTRSRTSRWRRGRRSSPGCASSSRCWRSTTWATGCATRSIPTCV